MTSTQPYYMNQNYSNYDSSYQYYNYNNNYYNPLSVSCTANKNFASVGEPVTWTAYVYEGSRNYSYTWSGTDNPTSLNANSINVSYGGSGTKSMSVTVWSANGQSSTAYCGQVTINQYQNQYNYPYTPPQLYQYPYAY